MSLRARLIVGLIALAAAGLLIAGGLTYAEQRSFLYDGVDQQARAATARDVPPRAPGGTARPFAGPGPGPGAGPGDHRGPGGEDRASLPASTYLEVRDASGGVVYRGTPGLLATDRAPDPPKLPATVATNTPFTVDASGSSSLRYRAYAVRTASGGLAIGAVPQNRVDGQLRSLLLVEALVIGGVLLALAVGAWWIVRLGLRPLDRIGATAGAIAAGDLSQRVQRAEPRTEVGRLGLSLNAMLERLEQAFAERRASEERLRRFLADASHELRTPLTSIRGYAELFRIGAADQPGDVEKAMSRIEDESARMGMLVEDLLTLARLDEVRDPIGEPVDMSALAGDAVDDARAVAPQREISLRSSGPVVVDGDPGQLRQVLANLVRNALVHTPAGSAIEVLVAVEDGNALLEVRDHGPGLPSDDPSDLFERFWRADPGRGRGRAGAGLGLAIVSAVVSAHGGRAGAANADGGGARFTVTLPLRTA